MPVQCAGQRMEPPKSVPSPKALMPEATAALSPPVEPPEVRLVSQGFQVSPKSGLRLCVSTANSEQLLLPNNTAPASCRRRTAVADCAGT